MTERRPVQPESSATRERLMVDCRRRGTRVDIDVCAACRYLVGLATDQHGLSVLCSYNADLTTQSPPAGS